MMRIPVLLFVVLASTSSATGQDMPLSQVLAPGEQWQPIPGVSGVFSLASDLNGTVYAGESASGRIMTIDPKGLVKAFATVPGVRGMAVGPDGRLYVCQRERRRLLVLDAKGAE